MSLNPQQVQDAAAIVCEHIAQDRCPVLSAFRTPPAGLEDSGWQFFCGKVNDEKPDRARLWLVREVLELEPSFEEYIDLLPGVQVWRPNAESKWRVRKIE